MGIMTSSVISLFPFLRINIYIFIFRKFVLVTTVLTIQICRDDDDDDQNRENSSSTSIVYF